MARKSKRTKSQRAKARQQQKAAARAQEVRTDTPQTPSSPSPELAKVGTFLSDIRKERAAQLLAEKDLTQTDVATAVGVSREWLRRWQQEPEFAARVAEHVKLLADTAQQHLIGRKAFRLGALNERWLLMQRVIDSRASQQTVPVQEGGETGLVVRRERMIGGGENAKAVEEFEVDLGLLKEMRETEKQAAQEAGQWTEKKEISGTGGGPLLLQIVEEVVEDDRVAPDTSETAPRAEAVPPE